MNLVCPFCGSNVRVSTCQGDPEGIECENFACSAEWDTKGNHVWGPFSVEE